MAKHKRDSEHPRVLLMRTLQGFVPAHEYAAEQLSHYPIGATVEATLYMERSNARMGLYWCILKSCVDNSENKYGSSEDLHGALKIALGYRHEIRMLGVGPGALLIDSLTAALTKASKLLANQTTNPILGAVAIALRQASRYADQLAEHLGETIVLPGSIAFDKMDESEFKIYLDRAFNELRKAGYPIDGYLEEAKNKLARMRPIKSTTENTNESNNQRSSSQRRDSDSALAGSEAKAAA